jgi:hypothetical protein
MKNIGVIYLEDYGLTEQDILNQKGIYTFRLRNGDPLADNVRPGLKFLLRANRLNDQEYAEHFRKLLNAGYLLVNEPEVFSMHGSFEMHYQLIKDYSPTSISINKGMDLNLAINAIQDAQLQAPIFVRSEIESAAKYVGVGGCLMQDISPDQFEACRNNLNQYVKNYQLLILKEVVEIKKYHEHNLEYRAVVIDNRIISFDFNITKIPNPESNGLNASINKIILDIYAKGFKGAYFMDFAVTVSDELIIIESKDILNGTIKDVSKFALRL